MDGIYIFSVRVIAGKEGAFVPAKDLGGFGVSPFNTRLEDELERIKEL